MKLQRQSVRAALLLVGVFLLGAVTGVVGAGLQAHRHLRMVFQGTPEEVDTRVTLTILSSALRLSDDERARVREVLEASAKEHSRLREPIEPGLAALRAKERDEVRAVLPPERRARFDEVIERIDERRGRVERLLDH